MREIAPDGEQTPTYTDESLPPASAVWGLPLEARNGILHAVVAAARIGMGDDVDFSDVDDRWMCLFQDVVEDVRDAVRREL